jgi:hypothetical protein
MLGFKRFRRAKVTVAGIELIHRIAKINSISANFKFRPNRHLLYEMPYSPHEKQPKHNPASAKVRICTRAHHLV